MHSHHKPADYKHGSYKAKFLIVILLNVVITVAEYIGGIISGSIALIADAGHNLSDVLSLVLGYAGEKLSGKEKTKSYTFGLKRFEVLIALVNSFSLFIIGLYIFYEAVERYRHPGVINIYIMVSVGAIGLAGNLLSVFFLGKDQDSNLNVRAAFLHLFFDALSSMAVVIAAIVIYFTSNYIIDIAISFIIVVMIIWSSLGIIRESLRIFLQGVPDYINFSSVYEVILGIEGVQNLHGLHIWSINSKEVFLSCHICIEPERVNHSDKIIMDINTALFWKFKIEHTVIQAEFSDFCVIN